MPFPRPLVLAPRGLVRAALVMLAAACTQVPVDDRRDDARLFPARGVLRQRRVHRPAPLLAAPGTSWATRS